MTIQGPGSRGRKVRREGVVWDNVYTAKSHRMRKFVNDDRMKGTKVQTLGGRAVAGAWLP